MRKTVCFLVLIAILCLAQVHIKFDFTFVKKKKNLYPQNLTIADLRNFSFSLNNDICSNDPVTFVIIVSSGLIDVEARNVLRQVFHLRSLNLLRIQNSFPSF